MIPKWLIIYSIIAHLPSSIPDSTQKPQDESKQKVTKIQRMTALAEGVIFIHLIYEMARELSDALVNGTHSIGKATLISHERYNLGLQEDVRQVNPQQENVPTEQAALVRQMITTHKTLQTNQIDEYIAAAKKNMLRVVLLIPLIHLHVKKTVRCYQVARG